MSGEKHQRQAVHKVLKKAKEDPIAVENRVYPGTPDTNYRGGWIELKRSLGFARNSGHEKRAVPCRHFTQQQRVWLIKRRMAGGRAHLLWQIGREWFLFDGLVAAKHVGRATEHLLRKVAIVVWPDKATMKKELVQWLYR